MATLLVSDDVWAVLTVWQEARGEGHDGRVAVAEVIRARMRTRYASDGTVAGTVLRAAQFSGWNTKDPNRVACAKLAVDDPMVRECRAAWDESAGTDLTCGAVLYLAPAAVPTAPPWVAASRKVAIIGRHHFYVPIA